MRRLPARRLLAAASIAGWLVVGLGASPASSAPPPSAGSGRVTFPLPAGVNPGLTVRQQVQGQALASGCMFSFAGTASPGSPALEWDEVEFDPASCSAVYAVGPVQHSESTNAADNAGGSGGSRGTAAVRAPARAASTTSAFYLKTYYEDPVGIDVTSLRNDVEWTYNYTCNSYYKWKRHAGWFTVSGWYLRYVNDSPFIGCNNAISNSDALMENDFFCSPESVYTHYNYNHMVNGKPNGSVVYSWNDYVSSNLGICYRLLSHHHSQGFESPW